MHTSMYMQTLNTLNSIFRLLRIDQSPAILNPKSLPNCEIYVATLFVASSTTIWISNKSADKSVDMTRAFKIFIRN